MKRRPSEASLLMWEQLKEVNSARTSVFKEYRFSDERKWSFDFALLFNNPSGFQKIGVEIDGGIWIQGRHTRGSGQLKDNEKFNEATLLGWRVLRFIPQQVLRGEAIAFIRRVLES